MRLTEDANFSFTSRKGFVTKVRTIHSALQAEAQMPKGSCVTKEKYPRFQIFLDGSNHTCETISRLRRVTGMGLVSGPSCPVARLPAGAQADRRESAEQSRGDDLTTTRGRDKV